MSLDTQRKLEASQARAQQNKEKARDASDKKLVRREEICANNIRTSLRLSL
jgi:hypothetical protein